MESEQFAFRIIVIRVVAVAERPQTKLQAEALRRFDGLKLQGAEYGIDAKTPKAPRAKSFNIASDSTLPIINHL